MLNKAKNWLKYCQFLLLIVVIIYYWDFEPIDDTQYKEQHWQDVTEDAAIAALQGLLANPHACYGDGTIKEDIVSKAMSCAYQLVNKLKEE